MPQEFASYLESIFPLSVPSRLRAYDFRASIFTIALFALLPLAGCGSDLPPTIKVSGKVTFDGGPCPKEGVVMLSPLEVADGMPRRPAYGAFGKDGKFAMTSFRDGDGLVPGRYAVRVDCWKRAPSGNGEPPISYVAENYTPPELEVKLGDGAKELNLDVPKLAE